MLLKDIGIKNAELEKSLDVDCLHAGPYSDIHRTCRNKCLQNCLPGWQMSFSPFSEKGPDPTCPTLSYIRPRTRTT